MGLNSRGHTESHASKLAVERWDDLADSLGSTGRGGNDVGSSTTTTPPVLVGGTVDGLLRGSGGMDGGHETLNDTELVVKDLGERSEAVSGARGVGDDLRSLGVIGVKVNTTHIHGCVSRGSRNDDLLSAALNMRRGLVDCCEHASGLDNVLGTDLAPWDGGGVLPDQPSALRTKTGFKKKTHFLTKDSNLVTVDNKLVTLVGNVALETTVDG